MKAGKLDKAEEIVGVVPPANEDPALPLDPGKERRCSGLTTPILRAPPASVAPMRRDHPGAVLSQLRIQRIARHSGDR